MLEQNWSNWFKNHGGALAFSMRDFKVSQQQPALAPNATPKRLSSPFS